MEVAASCSTSDARDRRWRMSFTLKAAALKVAIFAAGVMQTGHPGSGAMIIGCGERVSQLR
jgi:hypothetical protein